VKVAELQAWREANPDDHAFAVFTRVSTPGGMKVADHQVIRVHETENVPVVISFGAHEMCSVSELPSASLRHAALLLWPSEGEELSAIEVLDLRSGTGLLTDGNTCSRRLVGQDLVRFAVGTAEVSVFHASPGGRFPADLPSDLDELATLTRTDPRGAPIKPIMGEPTAEVPKIHRRARRPFPRAGFDEVTRVGSVVFRDQGGWRRRYASAPVPIDKVVVPCTEDALAQGVLLGRYTRCDASNSFANSINVSRVHALVVTRRGQTWLIDVGSTNGTEVFALASGETIVDLWGDNRVWQLGDGEGFRVSDVEVLLEVAN
jgi:hypothetical protein